MTRLMRQLLSRLKTPLKFTLVLALLFFLSQKGLLSLEKTGRAFLQWKVMLPAILTLFFTTFLSFARWKLLLSAQGIQITWSRLLQLSMIGAFFNIALPGAVSGDVVKAIYVGKEIGGQRARAFGSILFDRVAGVGALVMVCAASFTLGIHEFSNSLILSGTRVFVVAAALGVVTFFGYIFVVKEMHDPFLRALRALEKRLPRLEAIRRVYEGLRHYHHHKKVVLQTLAISMIIHLLVGWVFSQFAIALGLTDLSLRSIYIAAPLGLLVTAIPVAPGGMGTGNLAFAVLFNMLGTTHGADLYTMFALVNIFIGLSGGVSYLRFKEKGELAQLSQ